MKLIKARKLEKDDMIGVLAPSSGSAALFPHRLDKAIKFLKSRGYRIREFNSSRKRRGWESLSAEERGKDIMNAFLDRSVKAIICTIGGEVANQTLEYLDFNKINKHPKIFCGYSDISVLHYAFYTKAGLVSFYGPALMTQFGEFPQPLEYTLDYFERAIAHNKPIGRIEPSHEWTDELLDWSKKLDVTRARKLKKNNRYEWLREGRAEGPIIGGCISSLMHLRGTEYWPDYRGRILFWEIPEGQDFTKGEPLPSIDAYLANLRLSGVFADIKGMIVGRAFRYSDEEIKMLKKKIIERTEGCHFPILYGADIGHTDPQITIPLGVNAMIDSDKNLFEITEAGVM